MLASLGLQTSVHVAEVGFFLILFAGVWLAASEIPRLKMSKERRIIAGIALALGGLLLIIATYWGSFGQFGHFGPPGH